MPWEFFPQNCFFFPGSILRRTLLPLKEFRIGARDLPPKKKYAHAQSTHTSTK